MQIKAEKLRVCYTEGNPVLSNVNMEAVQGQWLMLLGPNGAGKSTLIKALSRTIAYEGTIKINDRDIKTIPPRKLARVVGVLQQSNPVNYAFTVEEIVRLGRYAHSNGIFSKPLAEDEDMVNQALEWTGLNDLRSRSILSLSGGEKQRAFLAQVFAQNPSILLLDEPSSSLDLKHQQRLFELVQKWLSMPDRCVISAVHDLSLAKKYGSHALLLSKGEAVAGGRIQDVFSDANLSRVYSMDVRGWMKDMLAQWV